MWLSSWAWWTVSTGRYCRLTTSALDGWCSSAWDGSPSGTKVTADHPRHLTQGPVTWATAGLPHLLTQGPVTWATADHPRHLTQGPVTWATAGIPRHLAQASALERTLQRNLAGFCSHNRRCSKSPTSGVTPESLRPWRISTLNPRHSSNSNRLGILFSFTTV